MGDSTENEESSDEESWAYKAGKAIGLKSKRQKPPLIDLDALKTQIEDKYKNRDEELEGEFKEASWWIGIVMELEDFRKFVWSEERKEESETTILFADIYDRHRRKAIKFKVERHLHINTKQIDIIEYYVTTKKGYIAWVKLDPRMITEIHKRAAKAAICEFRTTTFVPKLARDRKARIDELLMEYRKTNKDFRYIVRNGERDLRVLIKRVSEGNYLPYRNLHLDVLGRLSPLKTSHKEKHDPEVEEGEVSMENFQQPRRRTRTESFVPKDVIFQNITSILNGFQLQHETKGK